MLRGSVLHLHLMREPLYCSIAMLRRGIQNVHPVCLFFFPASIFLAGKKFSPLPLLLYDAIETGVASMNGRVQIRRGKAA